MQKQCKTKYSYKFLLALYELTDTEQMRFVSGQNPLNNYTNLTDRKNPHKWGNLKSAKPVNGSAEAG